MEYLIVELVVRVVFGVICAMIADSRGRSTVGWFFIGLLLGCIGLIIVLCLANLKEQQARELRLQMENRRLRERVKKDRMVADQRHENVERRLQVHDRALGVETAEEHHELEQAASHQLGPPPSLAADGPEAVMWHYVDGQERMGPVEFNELQDLWFDRIIHDNTLVWHPELGDWTAIANVPRLRPALDGRHQ